MQVTTLVIDDIKPSVPCNFKGIREHLSHGEIAFDPNMFEIRPASEFSDGTPGDVRREVLKQGFIPLNATVLEFIIKNRKEPEIAQMLELWKGTEEYARTIYFFGTIYSSLTYNCSGDSQMLHYSEEYGWSAIPSCLDGDKPCSFHYVAVIKK